jgi:hypothetical protein
MHKSQQKHAKQRKIKFSITTQHKQMNKIEHNWKNEERDPRKLGKDKQWALLEMNTTTQVLTPSATTTSQTKRKKKASITREKHIQ